MSSVSPSFLGRVVHVGIVVVALMQMGFPSLSQPALAQLGGTSYSQNTSGVGVPDLIAGRVVNATTGAPLPRVLVQIGGRSMLTDQEGRFRFEQPGEPISALRMTKPGFSMTPGQPEGSTDGVPDAGDPGSLNIGIWPEALLVGTVRSAEGEPLSHISVQVRRSVFDDQGRRSQIAGQRQTDSHGEFRLPLPAGDYSVETQFSPRGFERQQAVLPITFPPHSSSAAASTLHLGSGEEQHVELRPGTSKTHVVSLPLESGDEGQPPQITARSSDGTSFSVNSSRSQDSGILRIDLPSGTYSLRAMRYSREGIQFGESSVNVPDHDISGPVLHLSALPSIPIEAIPETSATQSAGSGSRLPDAPPGAMQFNLALQPVDSDPSSPFQFGIRPTQLRDSGASLAAPPGVYRLTANLAGGWFIRSATSRGTDLLRENLIVSPGSSPSPITLVVSNQVGSLQGTVQLSGRPGMCWVYLLATSPALPGVLIRRTDSGGRFSLTIPAGSYRAVAFPFRPSANLQDPEVLNSYSTHVGAVTVLAGATANLDLDAVTAKELVP